MKKFLYVGVSSLLLMSMASCHSDDPNYDDVLPPEMAVYNDICGAVAGMDGIGLVGATITISGPQSGTTTTDSNGCFLFDDVLPGVYTIEASAPEKVTKSGEITVSSKISENSAWVVMLASVGNSVDMEIKSDTRSQEEIKAETLADNPLAEVPMTLDVPENSLSKDATITFQAIYEASEAGNATKAWSRAYSLTRDDEDEDTMLLGVTVSCSDSSVKIENPLQVSFDVDEETAIAVTTKKYENGNWIEVPYTRDGGKVVIEATEFTSYGIFFDINYSISQKTEPITFAQSEWDNLYGATDMQVTQTTYDYKLGTNLETEAWSVLGALLKEMMAMKYGANFSDVQGVYPINTTLPIGTALRLKGTQDVTEIKASAFGHTVVGKQYGTVYVETNTFNRQHNGGSNLN